MKLYTIQHAAAWAKTEHYGVLTGDEHFADPDLLTGYRWMQAQMTVRLPNYSGHLPIWAWLKRPDLRRRWAETGESMVLLTINVPLERVLVSDHEGWHFVLNKSYLGCDDADFDSHQSPSDEGTVASWERVFGPFPIWNEYPDTELQACVDQVFLHEIKRVRSFVSR